MSLPAIAAPEYRIQLKSIKEPVSFRPYTVKEEKLFLMAKESNDPKDMESAVQQVLRNCTFGKVNIDKLPSFDAEYLFLQLRAKSVNNVVDISYRCENFVEKNGERTRCHTINPVRIPLDDITITTPERHKTLIQIDDNVSIEFQYPTATLLTEILTHTESMFVMSSKVVASCIKSIIEKNGTVHEACDYSQDELITFIESLTLSQVDKCQDFFAAMPSLTYKTSFVCKSCGYAEEIVFSGLSDFFG